MDALNTQRNAEWANKAENRSRCNFSKVIVSAYRLRSARRVCVWLAMRFEGGSFLSESLREILVRYHGVQVGKYSYGSCLEPGVLPKGTEVGRYCSFATDLKVLRRNHPIAGISQHPFFYNRTLGLVERDTIPAIEDNPMIVGSDVWIGDGVTILAKCKSIGVGAVIGACSVVTKDVDPFTIVAGNPARVIGRRYSERVEKIVFESNWWEMPLVDLVNAYQTLSRKININWPET